MNDEPSLSRREADLIIQQGVLANEERMAAHRREHEEAAAALRLAMVNTQELIDQHNSAHNSAHVAHAEKHAAESLAVVTALDAVAREREIHAKAHEREHESHLREHGLNNQAIDKAEAANDKRFVAANGYREAYESRVQAAASKESVEALRKELDRRLVVVERNDTRAEGRGIGQSALVAYTVAGLSIIGSLIVALNVLLR